jgi:hypothetical protein
MYAGWCVPNETINDKHCTIVWHHIDDLKALHSHIDLQVVSGIIQQQLQNKEIAKQSPPLTTLHMEKWHEPCWHDIWLTTTLMGRCKLNKMADYSSRICWTLVNNTDIIDAVRQPARTKALSHLFETKNKNPVLLAKPTSWFLPTQCCQKPIFLVCEPHSHARHSHYSHVPVCNTKRTHPRWPYKYWPATRVMKCR